MLGFTTHGLNYCRMSMQARVMAKNATTASPVYESPFITTLQDWDATTPGYVKWTELP